MQYAQTNIPHHQQTQQRKHNTTHHTIHIQLTTKLFIRNVMLLCGCLYRSEYASLLWFQPLGTKVSFATFIICVMSKSAWCCACACACGCECACAWCACACARVRMWMCVLSLSKFMNKAHLPFGSMSCSPVPTHLNCIPFITKWSTKATTSCAFLNCGFSSLSALAIVSLRDNAGGAAGFVSAIAEWSEKCESKKLLQMLGSPLHAINKNGFACVLRKHVRMTLKICCNHVEVRNSTWNKRPSPLRIKSLLAVTRLLTYPKPRHLPIRVTPCSLSHRTLP